MLKNIACTPVLLSCQRLSWVERIVLVVSEEAMSQHKTTSHTWPKVCVVQGHSTRHRSIQAGVQQLETGKQMFYFCLLTINYIIYVNHYTLTWSMYFAFSVER